MAINYLDKVGLEYTINKLKRKEYSTEFEGVELELDNVTENTPINITPEGDTTQETIEGEEGTTVEGQEISITDYDSSKEHDVLVEGESNQETTEGKNLLPNTATSQTVNGITFTVNNDKTITVNGTATAQATLKIYQDTNLLENGNYIVNGCPANGSSSTYRFRLFRTNISALPQTGNNVSFSITDNYKFNYIDIAIEQGTTINNLIFKPMIRKASIEDDTYEPYTNGPSPNPERPSDLKDVTGLQKVEFTGKNLLLNTATTTTINGITFTVNNDKTITANGTATANASIIVGKINTTSDKSYILSGCPEGGIEGNTYTMYISGINPPVNDYGSGQIIENTTINNKNLVIVIFKGYTASNLIFKPMIRLASIEDDTYEPYKSKTYKFNFGKNLFDKDNANVLENLYLNGSGIVSYGDIGRLIYLNCQPNTTYTISKMLVEPSNTNIFRVGTTNAIPQLNDNCIDFIDDTPGSTTKVRTITTSADAKYIVLYCYRTDSTTTLQEILDSIQIEKGPEATSYSEYFEPIHLRSNKDKTVRDYVHKIGSDWYIHRQINEIVLDGSDDEGWGYSSSNVLFVSDVIRNIAEHNNEMFCSHFTIVPISTTYANMPNGTIRQDNNSPRLIVKYTNYTNVNDFKTWLSNNNVKVQYQLAEQIEEKITNTELISQLEELYNDEFFDGVNNISTSGIYLNLHYNYVTPSPSPERPSDLKDVTGLQKVEFTGKNLLNENNKIVGYGFDNTNNVITTSSTHDIYIIPVKSGENYVSSANLGTTSGNIAYAYSSAIPQLNSPIIGRTTTNISILNGGTFTVPNNVKYLLIRITRDSQILTKWQIEKNSTATEYEPYKSKSYELNFGKNLFDKDNANILDAYIGSSSVISAVGLKTLYIPINPNTTYTVSKISSTRFIVATTENIPSNGVPTIDRIASYVATEITISSSSNARYLVVFYYNENSDTLTEQEILDSIQIEKGSKATEYSSYFTPIHLRSNKDKTVRDYVHKVGNDWFIHRNIKEYELDTSNLVLNNSQSNLLYGTFLKPTDDITYNSFYQSKVTSMCNKAISIISSNANTVNNIGKITPSFSKTSYFVGFALNTTLEDMKTSLVDLKLQYQLAEPIEEQITNTELVEQLNALEEAKLFNDKTYITVDSENNKVTLKVSYEKSHVLNSLDKNELIERIQNLEELVNNILSSTE